MTTERLSMRQIREILRQKWVLGRPHREVAESLRIGLGTISVVLEKAKQAGLDWPTVQTLTDEALEARLYTRPLVALPASAPRPWPDCAYIHRERRKPGVTLELLHLEYLEKHPDGYRYTQYCEIYRRWLTDRGLSMRQVHRAGEKLFVDYSGKKPALIDSTTGELIEVEFFVAVLGASNYTYAEATRTQQVHDWIGSHERAFAFFGGVTEVVVCDQLKSGVTRPCRYEPGLQHTFEEFGQHYNTVILPARPKRPRDKPKAEVAVQVAQRWILARLRHERFFSLAALNARVRELLEPLNAKVMRAYRASRRELFAQLDQPALRPLPTEPFALGEWTIDARVNIDYHIDVHGHYYSVPYQLLHLEWSPLRLIDWARTIGPQTAALVAAILADRPHPEQGYRSCLGILRLAKGYGGERLEAACGRAGAAQARSYRHVDAILKHGLDRLPLAVEAHAPLTLVPAHENLRGPAYYQ